MSPDEQLEVAVKVNVTMITIMAIMATVVVVTMADIILVDIKEEVNNVFFV